MRIISLLPSATEIVCALGAREALVGRSAECDFPSDVRTVPVVMKARTLDGERPSGEIDRRVRRARGAGESLYELDVDLLSGLRPDLLLTQDLCGVCSVTEAEVTEACRRAGVRPKIVSLSPRTLEDVWASVGTIGGAIGCAGPARSLVAQLRRRSRPPRLPTPRRVAVLEWLDPPILAGLWVPSMISAAGGVAVGPPPGEAGARLDWPGLSALRPELLVVSPCSFPVERTASELRDRGLATALRWAAPTARIYLADEAYFSRPGPRLADGIELLRALFRERGERPSMAVTPWPGPMLEAGQ